MIEQDPFTSRAQCVVQVAADGTASLTSLGKPPTRVRADYDAPWFTIRKDETTPLIDGVQISLASPFSWTQEVGWGAAIFTCCCREDSAGMGSNYVEYSEDGLWMWDGSEWVAAPQVS